MCSMKILLADDERTIAVTLGDALRGAGHTVTVVPDGDQAISSLKTDSFDCVITDIRLPKADGLKVLRAAKEAQPASRVILITAYASVEDAVAAIKDGAEDYIQKPFYNDDVIARLKKLERLHSLEQENKQLKEELAGRRSFGAMVGKAPKMQAVYDLVTSVAASEVNVLIEGESGTGKERVAEAIHYNSPRRAKPLVKMSCSVFPETLIEDELFGHVKGAFTDAKTDKSGRFERAHTGTIFIDDIDDLQPIPQVKLLRVLQEREFERIGATQSIKVDVRIVVATKKDLWQLVQTNQFREDLFHRLNVVKVRIPPLRERSEDIPLLVGHFIQKFAKGRDFAVTPEVLEALQGYSWPGNVRELEHAIERSIALAGDERVLKKEHLLRPLSMAGTDVPPTGKLATLKEMVAEAETRHIRSVVAYTQGHRGEASRILGITRKNLWEKMREYGIEG
ncbi:MAG: sigma-54-dependent Fis family transcriptional regulator [Planctomycetota bacterium]|nr:MAG: sigma-54-dependent Fis family transcriptional regulator [Planctomycetota bacterium]